MEYSFQPNALYYGDCLPVLRRWPDGCVDLIYLDPPFNSKQDYNVLFASVENRAPESGGGGSGLKNGRSRNGQPTNGRTQVKAYQDTWFWNAEAQQRVAELTRVSTAVGDCFRGLQHILGESGMLAYLSYMAQRLIELRRVLKDMGSLYLHCDPTAGHYLKVVLDAVFGVENFRNEIVWCYTGPGRVSKWFPRKHDTIFFYSKDSTEQKKLNFDSIRISYKQLNIQHRSENIGGGIGGRLTPENVEEYRERGKIPEDYWLEDRDGMTPVGRLKNERVGTPTQKPLALLNRIIQASSNPGDLVLDPFVGSGTTAVAAAQLNRRFAGIDLASFMLDIAQRRLEGHPVATFGVPQHFGDAKRLVAENPFAFEKWAIERIPGLLANQVQVGDGGIDGVGRVAFPLEQAPSNLVLAQVKGGQFRPNDLRAFRGVMASEEAALGIFITLRKVEGQQRRNAERELAGFGSLQQGAAKFPRLQLWSIEEYYDARLPMLPTLAHPFTGRPLEGPLI
ncbi:MAG: site-specific DNA-methyltransferase [Anaerolineaceae bacterium]|nr:site-specific DNA-methyltransferase [Anaerolineaceae bacterium]